MLETQHLSFDMGGKTLLYPVSLQFAPGRFHVVMGPNGAGKSTLLKLLAADLRPSGGAIFFNGRSLHQYRKTELAQQRAVLSQQYALTFPVTVQDVVAMGLYPFAGKIPAETEAAQCKTAMEAMDIYPLRHRVYQTLSGGEAQKVQMSRVLAQIGDANRQHKLLLLDEPVSHLDIKYQHQLLRAARRLCADGVTVVAVLHDLNLALAYAHRLLLLHQGRLAFDLSQPESITPEMVYSVFSIDACLIKREGLPPVVCFG